MTRFHTDEYIAFLKNITPDIQDRYQPQMDRCISHQEKSLTGQIIAEMTVPYGLACTSFAQYPPGRLILVNDFTNRK